MRSINDYSQHQRQAGRSPIEEVGKKQQPERQPRENNSAAREIIDASPETPDVEKEKRQHDHRRYDPPLPMNARIVREDLRRPQKQNVRQRGPLVEERARYLPAAISQQEDGSDQGNPTPPDVLPQYRIPSKPNRQASEYPQD